MTPTPRDRCNAALAAYDEVANAMCHIGARRDNPAVERTLRELGSAMQELYGDLPEERIVWHKHNEGDREWCDICDEPHRSCDAVRP